MVFPCELSAVSVLSHMIYPSDPLSDGLLLKCLFTNPHPQNILMKEDSLVIVPVVDVEASLQVDVKAKRSVNSVLVSVCLCGGGGQHGQFPGSVVTVP